MSELPPDETDLGRPKAAAHEAHGAQTFAATSAPTSTPIADMVDEPVQPKLDPPWQALKLARCGIAVFACKPDKTPYTPHGFKDASTEPAVITAQWAQWPDALVAVPTGIMFDVLDLDLQHESARRWHDEHRRRLPITRMHRTKSGGLHLLFKRHGVKSSAGLISANIDTRGRGGYIVWWPAHGFEAKYPSILAPMPMWLVMALDPPSSAPRAASGATASCGDGWLRGLVRTVAGASKGQRNHTLFWAACRAGEAVRDGKATVDYVASVLVEAAACAGLPQPEAQRTVHSGLQTTGGRT